MCHPAILQIIPPITLEHCLDVNSVTYLTCLPLLNRQLDFLWLGTQTSYMFENYDWKPSKSGREVQEIGVCFLGLVFAVIPMSILQYCLVFEIF